MIWANLNKIEISPDNEITVSVWLHIAKQDKETTQC
jgi:hypothetical protein